MEHLRPPDRSPAATPAPGAPGAGPAEAADKPATPESSARSGQVPLLRESMESLLRRLQELMAEIDAHLKRDRKDDARD